jgi:hypothetical protein
LFATDNGYEERASVRRCRLSLAHPARRLVWLARLRRRRPADRPALLVARPAAGVPASGAPEFAANNGKTNAPASYLEHGGLERPVDLRFNQDGTSLYVVDFGVMTMHGKQTAPRKETRVLWRITRADAR